MPSYGADKLLTSPKHGFVIRTHLPYITINFLRVETKKVLFSLDGLNKIHASWGCPVQTLSIIGCPPRSKETTNEFAWHWCHLIIHSCGDPSWLPGGSWDTPTAVGNILRALEQNLCSPILFPHRTMSNTSNAQHSGATKHILAPGCHPPVRDTHRALVRWCYLRGVCTELWGHLKALWLTLARKHPLGGRVYITDKRDPVPAIRSILLCLSYRGRVSFPLLKVPGLLLVWFFGSSWPIWNMYIHTCTCMYVIYILSWLWSVYFIKLV